MRYRWTFRAGCSLSLPNWINGKSKNDRPRLCWRPLTLTKPSVSRPILPSCRTYCGGSAILVTLAPVLPLGDYVMCLVLLQSRRHHQVQNQSHRTLDIEFHRQCLYQLHHRRRSLGTFLFSCAPHVELYFAAHSSAASVSLVDRMDWRLPAERFYSGSGNEVTVREGEDKRPLDLRSDLLQQDTGFAWGHEGAGAVDISVHINSGRYQFWMRCRNVTTSLPKGSERP